MEDSIFYQNIIILFKIKQYIVQETWIQLLKNQNNLFNKIRTLYSYMIQTKTQQIVKKL